MRPPPLPADHPSPFRTRPSADAFPNSTPYPGDGLLGLCCLLCDPTSSPLHPLPFPTRPSALSLRRRPTSPSVFPDGYPTICMEDRAGHNYTEFQQQGLDDIFTDDGFIQWGITNPNTTGPCDEPCDTDPTDTVTIWIRDWPRCGQLPKTFHFSTVEVAASKFHGSIGEPHTGSAANTTPCRRAQPPQERHDTA